MTGTPRGCESVLSGSTTAKRIGGSFRGFPRRHLDQGRGEAVRASRVSVRGEDRLVRGSGSAATSDQRAVDITNSFVLLGRGASPLALMRGVDGVVRAPLRRCLQAGDLVGTSEVLELL